MCRGRSSSVRDVLIDFGGVVCGLFAALLILMFCRMCYILFVHRNEGVKGHANCPGMAAGPAAPCGRAGPGSNARAAGGPWRAAEKLQVCADRRHERQGNGGGDYREHFVQGRYKTGLTVSPYVLEFRERFQIDGEMIPQETLEQLAGEVRAAAARCPEPPVQFEAVTAVALLWFSRKQCELAVLETGLGGRFDATNAVEKYAGGSHYPDRPGPHRAAGRYRCPDRGRKGGDY